MAEMSSASSALYKSLACLPATEDWFSILEIVCAGVLFASDQLHVSLPLPVQRAGAATVLQPQRRLRHHHRPGLSGDGQSQIPTRGGRAGGLRQHSARQRSAAEPARLPGRHCWAARPISCPVFHGAAAAAHPKESLMNDRTLPIGRTLLHCRPSGELWTLLAQAEWL